MSPKVEMLLAALRQENNRYLEAIANVSAVVGELAEAVEVLQRQLGGCNVAATQALRVAGGAAIVGELSTLLWMVIGIGLLLLVKSPVMSLMLLAWGCLDGSRWRGVCSVLLMLPVDPLGALAFAGFQIREAREIMEEERTLNQGTASTSGSASGSRIPRPVSTCRVNTGTPASQTSGGGNDAEEIVFHDVRPDPADAGVPLPDVSGHLAGPVRRSRPWYVRAVLGAMDGMVQGDAP